MASLRKEVYKPETDVVKKKKATFADGEPFKFGQTAGGVQGNLENLKIVKEQINKDVKISETGKQEFAKELSRLKVFQKPVARSFLTKSCFRNFVQNSPSKHCLKQTRN